MARIVATTYGASPATDRLRIWRRSSSDISLDSMCARARRMWRFSAPNATDMSRNEPL